MATSLGIYPTFSDKAMLKPLLFAGLLPWLYISVKFSYWCLWMGMGGNGWEWMGMGEWDDYY